MKKDKNVFTTEDSFSRMIESLEIIDKRMKRINSKIESIENEENEKKLTTKEKYEILEILNTVLENNFSGLGYLSKKNSKKLQYLNTDVEKYKRLMDQREALEIKLKRTLQRKITFKHFGKENCSHIFVKLEGRLECICCGHSSLEYSLTEEETKWLVWSAKVQDIFVEQVKKEDLPFLKKMVAEEKENLGAYFYQYNLLKAHDYDTSNPLLQNQETFPLSSEKACDLYWKIENSIDLIKKTCYSEFKELLLQECQVAQYEVRILRGENMRILFEKAENEEEKFAIAKAYYNLSHEYFRKNSGYFKNEQEAEKFVCLTAHPEINQMILDRKVRREN